MKVILKDNRHYILRFDKDEDIIEELISFATEHHIAAGTFSAIGASTEVTLAYYHLESKTYEDHVLSEDMEIVSVTGNIGTMNNKPIIHAHGVFANRELTSFGGHIKKLVVSATCEVFLIKLEGKLNRMFDEETGLNLLQ